MTYQAKNFGENLSPKQQEMMRQMQEQAPAQEVPAGVPSATPVPAVPVATIPVGSPAIGPETSLPQPHQEPQPPTEAPVVPDVKSAADALYADMLAGDLAGIEQKMSPTPSK